MSTDRKIDGVAYQLTYRYLYTQYRRQGQARAIRNPFLFGIDVEYFGACPSLASDGDDDWPVSSQSLPPTVLSDAVAGWSAYQHGAGLVDEDTERMHRQSTGGIG